jgi:hypothetical protein
MWGKGSRWKGKFDKKNKIKGVFGKQTYKLRTARQFING